MKSQGYGLVGGIGEYEGALGQRDAEPRNARICRGRGVHWVEPGSSCRDKDPARMIRETAQQAP